jgi:hypothetical protein
MMMSKKQREKVMRKIETAFPNSDHLYKRDLLLALRDDDKRREDWPDIVSRLIPPDKRDNDVFPESLRNFLEETYPLEKRLSDFYEINKGLDSPQRRAIALFLEWFADEKADSKSVKKRLERAIKYWSL